jgi:hypothetical protein
MWEKRTLQLALVAGLLAIAPPVNVRTTNTTLATLDVQFDGRGVVIDYVYSRQTRPEREVY